MAEPADSKTPAPAGLAQRIEKLLRGLERAKRQPNRREAYHLREALEMIETERYAEAEAAVIKAEHASPLPAHVATLVETNNLGTAEQLRSELGKILQQDRQRG